MSLFYSFPFVISYLNTLFFLRKVIMNVREKIPRLLYGGGKSEIFKGLGGKRDYAYEAKTL